MLPLKKVKYENVMKLVKNKVTSDKLYFYKVLKSKTVGPNDDISIEGDNGQAEPLIL